MLELETLIKGGSGMATEFEKSCIDEDEDDTDVLRCPESLQNELYDESSPSGAS